LIFVAFAMSGETSSASRLAGTPRAVYATAFFQDGVDARGNAAIARQHFAKAAEGFDQQWMKPGLHSPALAVNRGRAHFLAGSLPQAIRAFRDGLDLYPWDAELQQALTAARAAVAYPVESDPVERVRPDPPNSLRHRVSPWDLFIAASVGSLLLTVGLARRLTARDGWSTPLAVAGLLGLLGVAVAGTHIATDRPGPVLVLITDEVLRTGNGPSFPTRIDTPLPRGAEVRELARRGGWVQVELPGGTAGWVQEAVVLDATREPVDPFQLVRD
jgi:hypothetical protein